MKKIGNSLIMKIDRSSLLIKIEKLKQIVRKSPDNVYELPQQVRHIIQTAPQALSDLEVAIKREEQQDLLPIQQVLNQLEMFIQWAVGLSAGKSMAKSIRSGSPPDLSATAQNRLNQRMTQFLMEHVDQEKYLDLIREFCGEEAIQENTVYMDPTRESEAFAQWIMHDKIVTGFSQRLIELFAKKVGELPSDERLLLELQLQDRPSIYRVMKICKDGDIGEEKGTYLVQDILSRKRELLKIRDRSTSASLNQEAVFIGRAIPTDKNSNAYLLLGSITQLPECLWEKLSVLIEKWRGEYAFANPYANEKDFFRAHHQRIRRFIYQ